MVLTGIAYQIYLGNIQFMFIGLGISFATGLFCWIFGGLGGGDVKLMTGIGVWLGAFPFLLILFCSCIFALIWVYLDYGKHNKTKREFATKLFSETKHLILAGFRKIETNKSDLVEPIPFGACLALSTTIITIKYII